MEWGRRGCGPYRPAPTPFHKNNAVNDTLTRSATHNGSLSDGDRGSVGSGNRIEPRRRTGNVPGQTRERFQWTTDLRRDILTCWQRSSPERKGYMARLHGLWVDKHPEFSHMKQQYLRDQVSYLRRNGFECLLLQGEGAVNQPPPPPAEDIQHPPEEQVLQVAETANMSNRKTKIHQKVFLKMDKISAANNALSQKLPENVDLWTLNCAVYEQATSVLRDNESQGVAERVAKTRKRIAQLQNKIEMARRRASQVQCVMTYITSGKKFTPRLRVIARSLRREHHTMNKTKLQTIKQRWIEKIKALVLARKCLLKRVRSIEQNYAFATNPSRIFKEKYTAVKKPPSRDEIEKFWKEVYGKVCTLDEDAAAIPLFRKFCIEQGLESNVEECAPITVEEVRKVVAKTKSFKAPGPDKINNFWWKKLTCTHQHLARIFTSYLNGTEPIPQWLVEGRTVLLPKTGDLSNPKNYRPIACLNTGYKLFTGILKERILTSIEPVWGLMGEQRGCKRGLAGCRENLLIDRCITQDAVVYHRNLSMAWIDYRKAFDCTNHELIIKLLECLSVHPNIIQCIKGLMLQWRTRFSITSGKRQVSTDVVTYMRGVFQGDSLSPLLFCITLLPLSIVLRQHRCGYKCGQPNNRVHRVNHVLYMDDLKLYASNEKELQMLVMAVAKYSRAIGMSFGLDKCACVHISRGSLKTAACEPEELQLFDGNTIRHLGVGENYVYLGIPQAGRQDIRGFKISLQKEYRQLLRKIWSSELSGKNKIQATNMLAVPLLLYTFGAIKWNVDELRALDTGTRKMMTIHRSHHPIASVQRIYLPRDQGGRGLLSLECLHRRMVLATACSVMNSTDPLLQLVHNHEIANKGAFLYSAADRAAGELRIDFNKRNVDDGAASLTSSVLKRRIKEAEQALLLQVHADKNVHGQFYKVLQGLEFSDRLSHMYLKSAGLKSETEGFLFACQDGVINTLMYRKYVMKKEVDNTNCRACKQYPETLRHILSGCPKYACHAYIERHNAALKVLYYHLRHQYGFDREPVLPYAQGDIESVVENEQCKIYWNFSFSTTHRISATKPDMVLQDHKRKVIYMIEFSAPAERNVIEKEMEKRMKYQELAFELRRLNPEYRVQIIPLIIGCLGGMTASFISQIKKVPTCEQKSELIAGRMQKAVLLGSLRLVRQHCSL